MQWFDIRQRKTLKLKYKLLFLTFIILIVLLFSKPLLISLARFLDVPNSNETCDVMIVEGGPSLAEYTVCEAVKVYEQGLTRRLLFVLHAYDLKPTIFAVPQYEKLVAAALDSMGVPPQDFDIMLVATKDPYTYNTAKALSDSLQDINSILIFNDSFHMRRSYLTYKKIFSERNISVHAFTLPIYLNAKNWWRSGNGWRRVVDEYIKLGFYRCNGYI